MRSALPLILALGCGPSAEPTDCGPAGIEVGTGELAFEPLVDGDSLELTYGPQGGYHLTGAVRATGLADPLAIDLSAVVVADGTEITAVHYERSGAPDGACHTAVTDLRGFVFLPGDTGSPQDIGEVLDGARVALTAQVVDGGGDAQQATVEVVLRRLVR